MKWLLVLATCLTSLYSNACSPDLSINFENKDYLDNDQVLIQVQIKNHCDEDFIADLRVMHIDLAGNTNLLIDEVPYFLPLDSGQEYSDVFLFEVNPMLKGGVHEIKAILADYYSMEHLTKINSGIRIKLDSSLHFDFVKIKAGSFKMGSPKHEDRRVNNEDQVDVVLTNDYFVQSTEVTQLQWYLVMKANPSKYSLKKFCPGTYLEIDGIKLCPNNPVETISLDTAKAFIDKLNTIQPNQKYRLLTEAEWEYAARAGTSSAYFFGNNTNLVDAYSWNRLNAKINNVFQTHPVRKKRASINGLFDIYGNVGEITSSRYSSSHVGGINPTGAQSGRYYICRGGNVASYLQYQRSAYRGTCITANDKIGMRLARDI